MTEGIIQKVFKPEIEYWQKALVADDSPRNKEFYSIQINNLKRLQQKLIKEIKILYEEYGHDEYLEVPLQELIGETEE